METKETSAEKRAEVRYFHRVASTHAVPLPNYPPLGEWQAIRINNTRLPCLPACLPALEAVCVRVCVQNSDNALDFNHKNAFSNGALFSLSQPLSLFVGVRV